MEGLSKGRHRSFSILPMPRSKMKLMVEDCFEFQTHKPEYDSVQEKMAELKEAGWKKLRYEKGHHYEGGRDPYDTGSHVNAYIYGEREIRPEDAKRFIQQHKKEIQGLKREMGEAHNEIDELESGIEGLMESMTEKLEAIAKLEAYLRSKE